MGTQMSYLLLELGVLAFVVSFTYGPWRVQQLAKRQFLVPSAILIVVWFAIDQLAVSLRLWDFPSDGGTLPARIIRLPIEEYLLFGIHGIVVIAIASAVEE